MRAIKTQKGFTIVETMIVMAVTGAMFVATAALVSGQLQRYQFRSSALNAKQQFIDVINDVGIGYLGVDDTGTGSGTSPYDTNIPSGRCKAPGTAASPTTDPGLSTCVYIGKKINVNAGAISSGLLIARDSLAVTGGDISGNDTTPGFGAGNVIFYDDHLMTKTNLPDSLEYFSSGTFYVIYDRLANNSNPTENKGEGLSVSIYEDVSGKFQKINSALLICAKSGNRYVSYGIGKGGSPSVEMEFDKNAGCP